MFYGRNNSLERKRHIIRVGRGKWSKRGQKTVELHFNADYLALEQAAHSKKKKQVKVNSLTNILNPKARIDKALVEERMVVNYEVQFLSETPKGFIKDLEITETIKPYKPEVFEEVYYLKVGRGRWKQKDSGIPMIKRSKMHTIQQTCFSGRKTLEEQRRSLQKILNHPCITSKRHLKKFQYKAELESISPKGNVRVYKVIRQDKRGLEMHKKIEITTGRNASRLRSSVRSYSQKRLKTRNLSFLLPFDELMGCNKIKLIKWIESQWESWMNWGNYVANAKGGRRWNLDHLIAFSHPDIDLSTIEGQKRVMSYKNIFPTAVKRNALKSHFTMTEWVGNQPFYFFDLSSNFYIFAL